MTETTDQTPHNPAMPTAPEVRQITREDIRVALRAGLTDFQRAPIYGLFFGAVFSIVGILIAFALFRGAASFWIFPVAAGFPLIGPFAAVGIYEVSRRLEAGEPVTWGAVLTAAFRQGNGQLPFFMVFAVFGFLVWIVLARVVFAVSFGTASVSNVMTSFGMFLTGPGITMLVIGTVVGAALAALLFALTVVAVPMLMDRDIDVVTAMITSVRAVLENREAMIFWGLMIVAGTIVAMLPLFIGMIFVFPVLGHTSWHVYRCTIGRD